MFPNIGTDILGRAYFTKSDVNQAKRYKDTINVNSLKTDIFHDLDKRYVNKNMKARTKSALIDIDRDLHSKKNRLKRILSQEDADFHNELIKVEESLKMQRLKDEQAKEVNLEQEKLKLEEEHLAKKKLELDMAKCAEIKEIISKRREKEIRSAQILQIKEKEEMKAEEKKIDKIWHSLMLDDVTTREKIELDKKAKELKKRSELRAILDSQVHLLNEIKVKKYYQEKDIEQERQVEAVKEEIVKQVEEKIKRKQSKIELGKHLMEQMKLARKSIEKSKNEVNDLENTIISSSFEEYQKNKLKKSQEKASLRKEVDLFNIHMANIKKYHEASEKTHESFITKAIFETNKNNDCKAIKIKSTKQEFIKDIILERDEQLKEKHKRLSELQKQKSLEIHNRIESENKLKEIKRLELEREKTKKTAYRKILDDQIKIANIEKKAILEKTKKEEREKLQSEVQCVEFLKKEINTEMIHPFAASIKKYSQPATAWYGYIPETKYLKY